MKNETFFEKFDQLAEAPNAVAKVRELVIQLAVQGRLVKQDLKDEPSHLLVRRVTANLPRKQTENPLLAEIEPSVTAETRYELPNGWTWIPLGHVGIWATGCGFPKQYQGETEAEFLFCKVSDMNLPGNEVEIRTTLNTIDREVMKKIRARANPPGTVIFPKIGGAIATNKRRLIVKPTIIDNNCSGIQPIGLTESRWLLLLMQSIDLAKYQSGTSVPAVSQGTLNPIRIGLPPLAEQHRIVAKVDELMVLCDRLEAQLQERETRHAALAQASLARFAEAPTPTNLNFLFHDSYTIEPADLRKTILSLAMQGKLVPQDPNDEPVSQHLRKIQDRKDELIRQKQIKKSDPSKAIDPNEVDHDIPDSWTWVRLVDICELITDGTHQTPKYTDTGRMFLSAQNIKPFKFLPEKHRVVSEADYQGYIKNRKPEKGDILLTRVGAGIGEAATIDQDLDFAFYVSVGLVRPVRGFVFPDFITLWLNSPDGTEKSSRHTYGKGVSQGNLNLSLIRNFLVPLPPLAEQRRIVAKVDQLMALVDRLEVQLNASRETATSLMDAIVAELTAKV